jgi:hypothetical protein
MFDEHGELQLRSRTVLVKAKRKKYRTADAEVEELENTPISLPWVSLQNEST